MLQRPQHREPTYPRPYSSRSATLSWDDVWAPSHAGGGARTAPIFRNVKRTDCGCLFRRAMSKVVCSSTLTRQLSQSDKFVSRSQRGVKLHASVYSLENLTELQHSNCTVGEALGLESIKFSTPTLQITVNFSVHQCHCHSATGSCSPAATSGWLEASQVQAGLRIPYTALLEAQRIVGITTAGRRCLILCAWLRSLLPRQVRGPNRIEGVFRRGAAIGASRLYNPSTDRSPHGSVQMSER